MALGLVAKAVAILVATCQLTCESARLRKNTTSAAVQPQAHLIRNATNSTVTALYHSSKRALTFPEFYNAHSTGRGIWKWSNALDAYQRHFSVFTGTPVSFAEVGVQSGGSIQMWQGVLGPACHVYGLDINPATNKFADAVTTITIGDQADTAMWQHFFTHTTAALDILVDDGGHEPNQMLVTLSQVFPRLNPGGFVVIEDIHGAQYVNSFFVPAAQFLANENVAGRLDSVHIYPYLAIFQRAGESGNHPKSVLQFTGTSAMVSELDQLWAEVPRHPGGHVILENAGWGPFLTAQGMSNFFTLFGALHTSDWFDVPTGCATTSAAVCSNIVRISQMQAAVTGVHIYANRLVVEVAAGQVQLQAVRRGTEWLPY